jgi:hypothetical protein
MVKTKSVRPFTKKAIVSETPEWAKWTFRIVFAITGVATFIIAGDPSIPDDVKVRIGVYLKGCRYACIYYFKDVWR